jgi:hypothetical protein
MNIVVKRDYDGYFLNWTKQLANQLRRLENKKIRVIEVNSGPYRSYGMRYDLEGTTLKLDFYSAVRTGFGSIGCTPEQLAKELTV